MFKANLIWYGVILLIAFLMFFVMWSAVSNEALKKPSPWNSCIWDD